METRIVDSKHLLTLAGILLILLVPAARALDVCGQTFLIIDGATDPVADINCETGYTMAASATVNFLAGAHISETYGGVGGGVFGSGGYNTINVYGGQVDTAFITVSTDTVTIYGNAFDPIPGILAEGQTQIKNTGYDTLIFTLNGTYQDGSLCALPCYLEVDGVINLNIPQTAPEIDVLPTMLTWDFGDVEVGQTGTVMVQIYNYGTADLNVSSVALTGDAAFAVTSGPATPLVIAPNTSIGVDFEVTFAPVAAGMVYANIEIVSDDEDESNVAIALNGAGIITEFPPTQQIADILEFFDASVAAGTLQGYGPGNSPQKRLNALHNMVEAASDLINAGDYIQAIEQLEAIAKKTDGVCKPQDFVVGEAVAELNAKIIAIIADLQ